MEGPKTVLNLVDELSPVNFGIWHAAIATAEVLKTEFGIETVLVFPETSNLIPTKEFPFVKFIPLKSTRTTEAKFFFQNWDSSRTVVASHGCWQFPTRWSAEAKKAGFRWVYTPHGMLEPWSMSQKRLKKFAYFHFFEKRLASKADWVRAVGSPELVNLNSSFSKTVLIPNGIYQSDFLPIHLKSEPVRILYLARLHHKKGVLPMVKGWEKSNLWKSINWELTIAGTDDGEQSKIEDFLAESPESNIRFIGPVFGEEKRNWLAKSHFYILPSLSEGFPTSVLEAMAAGLVAIITKGCNFPEALEAGVAIETEPTLSSIASTFNELPKIVELGLLEKAKQTQDWVKSHYLWDSIAEMQARTYF